MKGYPAMMNHTNCVDLGSLARVYGTKRWER